MHAGTVDGNKGIITAAERKLEEGRPEMMKVAAHRDAARERRERLERGEDAAGGLGKPPDLRRILREAGWTESDIRHATDLAALAQVMDWDLVMRAMTTVGIAAMKRAERSIVRDLVAGVQDHQAAECKRRSNNPSLKRPGIPAAPE